MDGQEEGRIFIVLMGGFRGGCWIHLMLKLLLDELTVGQVDHLIQAGVVRNGARTIRTRLGPNQSLN